MSGAVPFITKGDGSRTVKVGRCCYAGWTCVGRPSCRQALMRGGLTCMMKSYFGTIAMWALLVDLFRLTRHGSILRVCVRGVWLWCASLCRGKASSTKGLASTTRNTLITCASLYQWCQNMVWNASLIHTKIHGLGFREDQAHLVGHLKLPAWISETLKRLEQRTCTTPTLSPAIHCPW